LKDTTTVAEQDEEFDEKKEERRQAMVARGDDIAAARDRVEDTSDDEEEGFEDGFTIKTILGAIFVGIIMMPGAIYLGLVAGQGLGAAAQWVTIVLFAEVCRRSFIPLRRQEIFLLYYMAGGLSYLALADRGISGGPFGGLIWNQYFVSTPQAALIAREIPWFATPQPESAGITGRTFFHKDWAGPILVLFGTQILERLSWVPAGYILFRMTSDIERLPFPLASVAAAGATALAESSTKEDSWRWNIFATGNTIGLVFGAFYIAIPVLTGVAFGKALTLIPIPFLDLMKSTESFLPAAPTGISGDLGLAMVGFVLPFPMVLGGFLSCVVCQLGLNPIFYRMGLLPQWHPGMETIPTTINNRFDLWISIGIGIQIAIALIGIYMIVKGSFEAARGLNKENRGAWNEVPKNRGDNPGTFKLAVGLWLLATLAYIVFTKWLLPAFPWWLLITYGLIWTPINSFVAARMYGLTSQDVNFPFLKELTIMKSGYTSVDVWFAPMPLHDYGSLAQRFREVELTRTKFTSIVKAELLMMVIILVGGLLYWQFIWNSSPIPSPQYPFAQKMWQQHAAQQAIWNQINKPGGATFALDALKPVVIVASSVVTLAAYGIAVLTKIPILAFYGAAHGANAMIHHQLPMFIGACFGKFYFSKRIGQERWVQYAPVLVAGFACGTGLISMGAIALALISKAVQPLPF
jgi:hypothetical protein